MSLETVDLDGVEILATGGPIHGQGSAAGGDYWTTADLRALAAADAELGDELQPPARLGHRPEEPAVGWVENVRVNADGSRLLADVKKVPKRVAQLIRAGAYRTRSVELGKVRSQRTGKVYEQAVLGLAWLGGRMPAVRTLEDAVRLYAADDGVELRRVYTTPPPNMERNEMSEQLLERAVVDGRIAIDEKDNWGRAFTADPGAASRLLEARSPDLRRALRNRQGQVCSRSLEDENGRTVSDEEYELEAGARLGLDFNRSGGGQGSDGYARESASMLGLAADEVI